MSENPISNVGRIEVDLAVRLNPNGTPAPKPQSTPVRAQPAEVETALQLPKVEQPVKKPANQLLDITLKFQVDEDTRDVTILILDRASHKLVRTIPPEAMNDMDPGELLQLFA